MNRDTLRTILHYLDQPLPVERRNEKNPPSVYPNRSMRRRFMPKKKAQTKAITSMDGSWFERWMRATKSNIEVGNRIHNAYVEEIIADQSKAERELYERRLAHFTDVYGEKKAQKIMEEIRRLEIYRMDKKMGIYG